MQKNLSMQGISMQGSLNVEGKCKERHVPQGAEKDSWNPGRQAFESLAL